LCSLGISRPVILFSERIVTYNSEAPARAELPSAKLLVHATLIAGCVAVVILVTAVLPAEYAIDPRGVGRGLGLAQMGEVKQQLSAEAEAEAAAGVVTEDTVAALGAVIEDKVELPSAEPASAWPDEVTLTRAPGAAAEIKLVMKAGETAGYAWTAKSGVLKSDVHGDGKGGQATSYRKGRAEASGPGDLTAACDGSDGWFWRNRGDETVERVLQVKGQYAEMRRVRWTPAAEISGHGFRFRMFRAIWRA